MNQRNKKMQESFFAPMFKDAKRLFEGAEQLDMSGVTDTQLMNLAISVQNQGQQATNQYNQTISNLAKQMESIKQKQQVLNVQSEKDKAAADKVAASTPTTPNPTEPIKDSLNAAKGSRVNEMNNVFSKDKGGVKPADNKSENKDNVIHEIVFAMLEDFNTLSTSVIKLYKQTNGDVWNVKVMLSTNEMKEFLSKLTFGSDFTKDEIFEYLHYTDLFKSLDELDIDEVDTLLKSLKQYQPDTHKSTENE